NKIVSANAPITQSGLLGCVTGADKIQLLRKTQ
ncbi:MAG: hypothetical protein ACI8YD_002596, partial [Rheinheimera aquimaris]